MKVADMILELAKQPLDAEVLVELKRNKYVELEKEAILYAGEVDLRKGKGPKKSILINIEAVSSQAEHLDVSIMEDEDGCHEVVFFPPFTEIEDALDKAIKIMSHRPDKRDYFTPTEEHVRIAWIMDNPAFEENPDEEDAYLYAGEKENHAYAVLEVRYKPIEWDVER